MANTQPSEPNQAGRSRRAQILRCTVDALVEVGYSRSSVAEIARRAGISKGVVSYHFPDKTALLGQVVIDLYRLAGAQIQDRVDLAANGRGALRAYLEANLDFIAANPRHVRAAAEVMANLTPRAGDTGTVDDPVGDGLAALLRDGQATGEFGEFDSRSLAMILRAAVDTAATRQITDSGFDLHAYRCELLRLAEQATRVAGEEPARRQDDA